MKKLIMDVLEDMSHGPSTITLTSPVFRETIAKAIMTAIKTKPGWNLDLSTLDNKPKIDEQKARETWVCDVCGKSTFEVDYDYIGSGTNHLGCELSSKEHSLENKVSWSETHSQFVTDDVVEKHKRGPDRRKSDRREKNWSQKKHEEKVFNQAVFGDSRDLTEAKLDNHQLPNDREYPYNSFVRNKEEADKLAEEIVSDNDTGYIYESPDGGKTVYKRKVGESERELVKDWKKINVRT
jgi:hypothetical protein